RRAHRVLPFVAFPVGRGAGALEHDVVGAQGERGIEVVVAPGVVEAGDEFAGVGVGHDAHRTYQPVSMSTRSGAWSDGSLPLRANRSTSAHGRRSTGGAVTYGGSRRMPGCWGKSPRR